eukprot:1075631-Pleurochrysis_carterae.AAC.2
MLPAALAEVRRLSAAQLQLTAGVKAAVIVLFLCHDCRLPNRLSDQWGCLGLDLERCQCVNRRKANNRLVAARSGASSKHRPISWLAFRVVIGAYAHIKASKMTLTRMLG